MNAVDIFLDQIRDAVLLSGRGQGLIARDAGISAKHMSEFMNDQSDPSLPVLRRLCDVLGIVRDP